MFRSSIQIMNVLNKSKRSRILCSEQWITVYQPTPFYAWHANISITISDTQSCMFFQFIYSRENCPAVGSM